MQGQGGEVFFDDSANSKVLDDDSVNTDALDLFEGSDEIRYFIVGDECVDREIDVFLFSQGDRPKFCKLFNSKICCAFTGGKPFETKIYSIAALAECV